jgi:hypothetical protein
VDDDMPDERFLMSKSSHVIDGCAGKFLTTKFRRSGTFVRSMSLVTVIQGLCIEKCGHEQ